MNEQQALAAASTEYAGVAASIKSELDWWIEEFIRPAKSVNYHHTSYGLKHLFHSSTQIYVTNDQFKGAMLANGYRPADYSQLNWNYRIRDVSFPTRHQKEAALEKRFSRHVKERGGLAIKFTSPGVSGVPDRMVLIPNGRMVFVELKAFGKKPEPLQLKRHQELRELGFQVWVISTESECNAFLEEFLPE